MLAWKSDPNFLNLSYLIISSILFMASLAWLLFCLGLGFKEGGNYPIKERYFLVGPKNISNPSSLDKIRWVPKFKWPIELRWVSRLVVMSVKSI